MAWLNQVAVSPDARRRGIAADLWRRARQWAFSQGTSSVGVDTATPADHLVRLYGSWGFVPFQSIHWPGKTHDSVVMTRRLTREDS
jgi:GNAT superfamily N-acetyltransferase